MSQHLSNQSAVDDAALEADKWFDQTLLTVNTVVDAAGLDANQAIELYMRSMWGMAMAAEPDPLIARAKLTAYFTEFSQQLAEQLESEAFKATFMRTN